MTNIAFVGNMRHGKTTAATHLVKNYGYEKRAFADGVKDMACRMLQSAGEFLVENGNDNGELTLDVNRRTLEAHKSHPSIRKFLQIVGSELVRDFYGPKDAWIQMLVNSLPTSAPVVVDDCRYRNEAEALRELGFVFVRVVRDKDSWYKEMNETYPDRDSLADAWDIMNHPSETEQKFFEIDWTFDEALTAKDLYRQVDELMENIRIML